MLYEFYGLWFWISQLTIITKRSILHVAAALDLPLNIVTDVINKTLITLSQLSS